MKKTFILAIILLLVTNLFIFFATIKLQNDFSAQMKKLSEGYHAKALSIREAINGELKEQHKEEIQRFANAFEKLKEEIKKRKELEGKRPIAVKNKKGS